MRLSSRQLALVRDAIEVVLRRLSAVAQSAEVVDLRSKAVACLRDSDAWQGSKPTAEERERLMKRILSLHVAVAKIERQP